MHPTVSCLPQMNRRFPRECGDERAFCKVCTRGASGLQISHKSDGWIFMYFHALILLSVRG